MSSTKTTCPYCGVGCGVEVLPAGDGGYSVRGDPSHPANFGRLCSKGSALGETLALDGRLLHPEINGERVGWEQALGHVASGFQRVIDQHGPDALAFYVSGQLLTEDYYVANKLMKGFIGSGNIDTNSRLCMSSSVAGHVRAFGADTVPGCYEDLELADLIVLVGSNTAWCHPVLFQRIRQAKQDRPELKVIVVDPRRTATCDIADLHLALQPGSDIALFNGLLDHLALAGRLDKDYIAAHTEGFEPALKAARRTGDPVSAVAQACGLAPEVVSDFFAAYTATEKTVTVYSQGVNQWSCGTDKVNAITNVHLATGRIGKPGMGPFSFTGQPNAMGGREVGGLANMLAAHMTFQEDHRAKLARFWGTDRLAERPGLKAVDLFQAIESGRVKAIWIMATNPAVSLPDADRFRAALQQCELVVVSDTERHTDTTAYADVLLPAAAWGEKCGTVTNSERRISRQRTFLPKPGEAKPDWWMVCQVARHMGFGESFKFESAAEIFREYAALTGFENDGERDLDLSGLAQLNDSEYYSLEPVQWPVNAENPHGTPRLLGDGRFFTAGHKGQFLATAERGASGQIDQQFPLVLNSGRIRDQWHTMTRTAKTPRLTNHIAEPFVEIHPADAAAVGLDDRGLARLRSAQGEMLARVRLCDDQRPGSVFVPMHWSDQFARQGRVGALVNAFLDPVSGQPEFKHTPVRVRAWRPAWQGFVLVRERLQALRPSSLIQEGRGSGVDYCTEVRGKSHWRYELAGKEPMDDWLGWVADLLGRGGDWPIYQDEQRGTLRIAKLVDGRLQACLFVANDASLPEPDWLASLFKAEDLAREDRVALLAGRPAAGRKTTGQVVCSCFDVGLTTIAEAIASQGLTSVAAIGEALKAGTNCGSCVPELRRILKHARSEA